MMIESGNPENNEVKMIENAESQSFSSRNTYKELKNYETWMNDLLFSDDNNIEQKNNNQELSEEKGNIEEKKNQEDNSKILDIKEMYDKLFFEDFIDTIKNMSETNGNDINESNIEKNDFVLEKIANSIGSPEGIKTLIEKHPEKSVLWKSQINALDIFNDPDASPVEIISAQKKLNNLKGQLLETAVKDALIDIGFDVESKQRIVEGENGGTRPDVIAKNNTSNPIEVFGITIQPGETICIECKCGGAAYLKNQLKIHIPNQLSGHEGKKVLLTTSDIRDIQEEFVNDVCEKYDASLVILDVRVGDVENAIKEVANK